MVRNILLFIGSIGVTLVGAEVLLHVWHPFDRMQTWIELHDRGFVQNQAGGTAYHELQGTGVTYRFDEHRFRQDHPNPGNTILLGDSYSFGLHLPDSSTLGYKTGWKNFAVGGAGTADYLAQLETYLSTWDADTVIVMVSIDDANRSMSKDLNRLDRDSQRWRNSDFRFFMESLPGYHALQRHSYLLNGFVRFAWRRWYFEELSTPGPPEDVSYVSELHQLQYARMRDLCEQAGVTLIIAVNGYAAIQQVDMYQQHLLEALPALTSALEIPLWDCSPQVKDAAGQGTPMTLGIDSHPGPEGINVLADCLSNYPP